jgi:hypothetical protein
MVKTASYLNCLPSVLEWFSKSKIKLGNDILAIHHDFPWQIPSENRMSLCTHFCFSLIQVRGVPRRRHIYFRQLAVGFMIGHTFGGLKLNRERLQYPETLVCNLDHKTLECENLYENLVCALDRR